MQLKQRFTNRERMRGQSLVLFVLFAFVLLGFSALAVDYGMWLLSRRDYQNAADSAALAGSPHLTQPSSGAGITSARQAAWQSLRGQLNLSLLDPAAQGLANTTQDSPYTENGYRIWVDSPANAAGSKYPGGFGSAATVFVRVERDNESFLGHAVGQGDKNVGAWATAGLWANRFAIVMLCGASNNSEGIRCPSNVRGVKIAGTTTGVTLTNGGDLGSNYGLTVTSSNSIGLLLQGGGQAYLVDLTCGSSTYLCPSSPGLLGGIQDGTSRLGGLPAPEITDPNYPEPSWIANSGAGQQVPNRCRNNGGNPVACTGHTSISTTSAGTIVNGTTSGITCSAGAQRLAPGTYDDVTVPSGQCVILDPTYDLKPGQQPGIYRFRGTLDIRSGAAVVGDGVSLFFEWNAGLDVGNGGAIVLNTGNNPLHLGDGLDWSYGAWTSQGATPWTVCGPSESPCTRLDSAYDRTVAGRGTPIYVRKVAGTTGDVINMAGGAGIQLRGIVYAPHDNVSLSGSSGQASAGKIVAWSIIYAGNTQLTQVYEDENIVPKPYLIEPRLGQP